MPTTKTPDGPESKLPTARDVEQAKAVVRQAIIQDILKLPPYLSVQMPNILRCLDALSTVFKNPYKDTSASGTTKKP